MAVHELATEPGRIALVNVDAQNIFVEAVPDGAATVERVNRLARLCRQAGVLVIHTRHVLRPDGSNLGRLGELVPMIRDGKLYEGAPSAELHALLEVERGDLVVEKPRYGAFHGTDLEEQLRSRGIDTVIISGFVTDVCCDTTAREANARDFHVWFLRDGSAPGGTDRANVQEQTLWRIGKLFGHVVTVADMAEMIRRLHRPR